MKAIYISLILSILTIFSNAQSDYPDTDLGVLMSIRDSIASDYGLKVHWADTSQADNWEGVTWDTDRHGRVIKLYLNGSDIEQLNISKLTELKELSCSSTNISKLDIINLTKLSSLSLGYNEHLYSIDLNNSANLEDLSFKNWSGDSLNLIGLIKLKNLYIQNGNLKSLDLGGLQLLETIEIFEVESLGELSVTGLVNLNSLNCYRCSLQELDLTGLVSLRFLRCDRNNLSKLIFTGCSNLEQVYCHINNLNSLETSDLISLEKIICLSNNFKSLDFKENQELNFLSCSDCNLESLTVSGLTKLKHLNCSNNQINSLITSDLKSLEELNCEFNNLEGLSLVNLDHFKSLYCSYNRLSSLYLSACDSLSEIRCKENELETLGVSNLERLKKVYCSSNNLKHIETNVNNRSYFDCEKNRLLFSELKPIMDIHGCDYVPQKYVFDPLDINVGELVDFSSEAMIDGTETEFNWFKETELIETNTTGKYTPLEAGIYSCRMKNVKIPDLELISNNISVGGEISEPVGDIAVLIKIRDASSEYSNIRSSWADTMYADSWRGVTWDTDRHGRVIGLDIPAVGLKEIDVTSLTNIQSLNCSNNSLISLNVTGLSNLQNLDCSNNNLDSLDLTGLRNLQLLICESNNLTNINLTGLNNLTELGCGFNNITSLDLRNFSQLQKLYCYDCKMSTLYISGLAHLKDILCPNNMLTTLNLEGLDSLETLVLYNNKIGSLDASNLKKIYNLDCANNLLSDLSISGCVNLQDLNCLSNNLETLNVSGFSKLTYLICNANKLTELNMVGCKNLVYLNCTHNRLVFSEIEELLQLNNFPSLSYYPQDKVFEPQTIIIGEEIDFSSEAIIDGTSTEFSWYKGDELLGANTTGKYIPTESGIYSCQMENSRFLGTLLISSDITVEEPEPTGDLAVLIAIRDAAPSNSPLKTEWADHSQADTWTGVTWDTDRHGRVLKLDVSNKGLTFLEVKPLSLLQELDCSYNELGYLDLSGLGNLQILKCSDNQGMDSLSLSGLSSLADLNCEATSLGILDLSNLGKLLGLSCDNCKITSLDLRNSPLLEELSCYHCSLSDLKISGLSNLKKVQCSENQLISLDLTGLTSLENLYCELNQIKSLDARLLVNLEYIDCHGNGLEVLKVAGNASIHQIDCFSNNLDSIDASNLPKLQNLFCQDNELTYLDLTGSNPYFYDLNCENNRLLFSMMEPLLSKTYFDRYDYVPQNYVFEPQTISAGAEIDFSGEAIIDGTATEFKWYKGNELVETNTTGKYTPTSAGIYNCKMTNAKFPALELTTHNITVEGNIGISLTINLEKGWNLFSLNHIPEDIDLEEVLSSLIDNNQLVKVIDEDSYTLEKSNNGNWENTIGNVYPSEGFKIKVTEDCQLTSHGSPIEFPLYIPLSAGWNIISFPLGTEVSGLKVIQQLIDRGTLVKVMDEAGNAIEDWGSYGGWTNNIGNFKPGEGYLVQVNSNDNLSIFENYE